MAEEQQSFDDDRSGINVAGKGAMMPLKVIDDQFTTVMQREGGFSSQPTKSRTPGYPSLAEMQMQQRRSKPGLSSKFNSTAVQSSVSNTSAYDHEHAATHQRELAKAFYMDV